MPKTPVTNSIVVDEFSIKYQLSDKVVYHVDKNTFCICAYNVISSHILECWHGESLHLTVIKLGSVSNLDKKALYAGDCGVSGWCHNERPQILFNSLEECLDNMCKIVEYYTRQQDNVYDLYLEESYELAKQYTGGYIQVPKFWRTKDVDCYGRYTRRMG